jgi:hypothetical protein
LAAERFDALAHAAQAIAFDLVAAAAIIVNFEATVSVGAFEP